MTFQIIDQNIKNITKTIHANAFITVSLSHVFFISIEIITFFTTFHNQYKNQINVIIKAMLIFVENQNV
jgi:hypothetical protein